MYLYRVLPLFDFWKSTLIEAVLIYFKLFLFNSKIFDFIKLTINANDNTIKLF